MKETTRPWSSATMMAEEFERLYRRAVERLVDQAIERRRLDPEKRKILDVLDPPAIEAKGTNHERNEDRKKPWFTFRPGTVSPPIISPRSR